MHGIIRRMVRIGILAVVIAFLLAGFVIWWFWGLQAVNPSDSSSRYFVVRVGSTVRQIGTSLKKEGFINDPVVFFLYLKLKGVDRQIQAGDYKLSASMNLEMLVDALTHGTIDIWVTFPEGMRAEEYSEILKEKIPSYNSSWEERLISENGYLFPDTYLIPKDADVEQTISILKDTFYRKIAELELSQEAPNLSEIVTIASLLEREAKTNEERPIISGIIKNRLDAGMALQVDATLQYIKGYDLEKKRWWGSVSSSDKRIDSPYNTYLYPGLPPSPIANPGLSALSAAINPAQTDYYYYLHDGSGRIHYAATLFQHNENVRRYLQ